MVDSADVDKLDSAKSELHALMDKPELASIPLLVLANKNDLPESLKITDIIKRLCVADQRIGLIRTEICRSSLAANARRTQSLLPIPPTSLPLPSGW